MRKMYWLGLVLCFSLLAGCAGQAATPEATQPPAAEETEVVVPATETSPAATAPVEPVADCEPYNLLDDILAPATDALPPITEGDHVLGPEDAKLTILEYSDFQ